MSSSSSSHQENAARLLDILNSTADVEINDEATHSLFGDLYSGQQILEALIEAATTQQHQQHDNVGMPVALPDHDSNTASSGGMVVLRSLDNPLTTFLSMKMDIITPHEMPLEIHNLSNATLRLRWINQEGGISNAADSHQWNIPPQSTFEQYCQPGHLFVLSVVSGNSNNIDAAAADAGEQILGAYRPKRPLPSLTAHALLVQEITPSLFLLETILLDATRFDALTVAAAALDYRHYYSIFKEQRESLEQTIHLLHTIVKNVVLHHPKEEKYHQLKFANSKMRQYIVNSWGAMEMLSILGFVEKTTTTTTAATSSSSENTTKATTDNNQVVDDDDDEKEQCLVMATPTPQATLDIGQHALHLLDILQSRVSTQFVSELAPPTPWQPPPAGNNMGGGQDAAAAVGRRGFVITDEERWARAERGARLRRSGGPRPSPGNAPSSRGKWGR